MMYPSSRARIVWCSLAVVAALALSPFVALAKPVAREEAAAAVNGWLRHPGHGLKARLGNAVKDIEIYKDAAGAPLYYVVNLKPTGFVIAPADDLVEPVICFSPEGKYVASDKNPLGALVMRDLPSRIAAARGPLAAAPQARQRDAQRKWSRFRTAAATGLAAASRSSVSDVRVDPLMQSLWDQAGVSTGYCYNYYTPNHYYSGCVATAMAQLMRFYQYPTAGVGTPGFVIYVNGVAQNNPKPTLRGGDGAGGPYDWANMPLVPTNATDTQRQAIGALCYDAGLSVNMQYSSSSSGAYPSAASWALKNVFYYNNVVFGDASGSASEFGGMINPNLDAGFPVLLSIYATNSGGQIVAGHEIVADGYGYDSSTLYHHLNMGWSGYNNAWYNLPVFSAGGYNWTILAYCIYNVYPSGSGEIISGRVADSVGAPISGATVHATGINGNSYSGTATTNTHGVFAFAKVPAAASYTLTASKSGYTFSPQNVTTGTSQTYGSTSGNVWGADFAPSASPQTWTLTVNSTPVQGAAISGTHPGTTNYSASALADGTAVSLNAPATVTSGGATYNFVSWAAPTGWTIAGATVSGTLHADSVLQAQYVGQWTLSVQAPTGNGATAPATGNYTYSVGTGATVQATAATGWNFDHWTGDGVASGHQTDNPLSVASGAAGQTQHVAAVFVQQPPPAQWTLSVQAPTGNGATAPAAGDYTYAVGTGASVQATAATGWNFDHWTGDGVASGHQADNPLSVASGAAGQTQHVAAVFVQQPPPAQWTLSVQAPTGNGATAPAAGDYTYAVGTGASVQATAATGWNFDHWTGDGVASGHQADNPLSVASGAAGQTQHVAAVFVQQPPAQWTLTVNSTPNPGVAITGTYPGTTNYSAAALPDGTAVSLSVPASDPSGFVFQDWKVTVGTATPVTTTQRTTASTVTADTTAVAEYQAITNCVANVQSTPVTSVWISSSTGDAGRTNYSKQGLAFGKAMNLTVPASDPAGYTFAQWRLNGAAQAAGQRTINFTVTGSTTAVAEYRSGGYIVAVQSAPVAGVGITSSTGHGGTTNYTKNVSSGAMMILMAPATVVSGGVKYSFVQWNAPTGWTVAGTTVVGVVRADTTFEADYSAQPTWTLSVQLPTGNGATSPATGNYTYAVGTGATVQATAATGWNFDHWTGDGVATGHEADNPLTVASGAAGQTQHIAAVFTQPQPPAQWTLSVQSPTGNGATSPATGNYTYAVGTGATIQATAATGWNFDHWTGDGVASGHEADNPLSVASGAAGQTLHVAAVFAQSQPQSQWTLSIGSTPNQGVQVSGTYPGVTNYSATSVADGASVSLSAPVSDPTGYTFVDWKVTVGAAAPAITAQRTAGFTVTADTAAVAEYQAVNGRTLIVQSTPLTGVPITSSTGQPGVTNYSMTLTPRASVHLAAPSGDPTGYTFSQWRLNGTAQSAGQKTISFFMTGATMTAVAEYKPLACIVNVQSTPMTGIAISSATGHSGTTNYSRQGIAYGTAMTLAAPASDPANYIFAQWRLNGTAQPAGQKTIDFTVNATRMTAVAEYTSVTYRLSVQSTPVGGVIIASATADGGPTNHESNVAVGEFVYLRAPTSDPPGYAFSQWRVNGKAQAAGRKVITFFMTGPTTAVAEYTALPKSH